MNIDRTEEASSYIQHNSMRLLTTVIFSAVVISFDKYAFMSLIPLSIYPIVLFGYSKLSLKQLVKRVLWLEPLFIGIGLLNPIFDKNHFWIMGFSLSYGWISLLTIINKSILIVSATYLMASEIAIEEALTGLHLPHLFVTQISLTYRYIGVLLNEIKNMELAYKLRSGINNKISIVHLGSFLGSLLLRTLDRAERIHQAMLLRGFDGQKIGYSNRKINLKDWGIFWGWCVAFILLKILGQWIW